MRSILSRNRTIFLCNGSCFLNTLYTASFCCFNCSLSLCNNESVTPSARVSARYGVTLYKLINPRSRKYCQRSASN